MLPSSGGGAVIVVRVEALGQRNVWLLGFVKQTAAPPPFPVGGGIFITIIIRGGVIGLREVVPRVL